MKLYRTILTVVAAIAAVAFAEPARELDAYKGNVGKWDCDAKEIRSGKAFKAGVEYTREFDGYTYVERYFEIANADRPNAWKGIFVMSYDAQAKRWVRNGIDNSGERDAASSSGWSGDTWVWANDGLAIPITRKGAGAYTFAVDVKENGKVKRIVEALCKRI